MLAVPKVKDGGEGKGAESANRLPVSVGISSDYMADLTRALRLSISGDNIDVELPQDVGKVGEGPATLVGGERMPTPNLTIPDNVPLDLRNKLAIAMVNSGMGVPSVSVSTRYCLLFGVAIVRI